MKKYFIALGSICALLAYACSYHSFLSNNHHTLQVAFLDVGQGDAVYIRAPNGNDVLIDGGPDDSVVRKLREVLPRFDGDIDLMIATHPDKDHIAGLSHILEGFEVRNVLMSEVSSGTSFDKDLQNKIAGETGVTRIIARRGQRFILDNRHGVYIDILFPDQDTSQFKESNTASVILRLAYGNISFMLTGDAYVEQERFVSLQGGASIRSTVLKLGHHGSKTSTDESFLDAVAPSYVVVSAGKDNSYRHPNEDIMKRVMKRNIKTVSTIDMGTIRFYTDGKDLWIK